MSEYRFSHFIGISQGKIELRFADDLIDAAPHVFAQEAEAASALAAAMLRTSVPTLLTSSSVNWPEEEGWPNFDFDRFLDLMRASLTSI